MENDLNTAIDRLSPEECRVRPWIAVDGDGTHRLDYPLTPESLVFDVGGFRGDWAAAIYERHGCQIEIFEPVDRFVRILEKRFAGNDRIVIHPFGLGGTPREVPIDIDEASSSIFKAGHRVQRIRLSAGGDAIAAAGRTVDLVKINVEGAEFELLDHLIDSGAIARIVDLQVQFHIFFTDASAERQRLQGRLSATHTLTYNYPWIWENWRLRN